MIERFIHHVRVERPDAAETVVEARERLRDKLPRTALRRATHLGLLVGSTLEGVTFSPVDAVVYASTYAETRALEDYLHSFPTPSPSLFQTSIHPSAVQQVLINRQQPVARLWPITGCERLAEQALLVGLLETAERVAVVGGEERGTWMLEHGAASDRAFAFALVLTCEAAGAMGRVAFQPASDLTPAGNASISFVAFATALAERRALRWCGTSGEWSIEWR
jgi:hypothetical protein